MNCCCARKPAVRESAPVQTPLRRGIPSGVPTSAINGRPGNVSSRQQNLGGVGIVFQAGQQGEGLVVASLAGDGPADQSGQVRAGDVLVSIDRIDVRGMSAEDLAQYILGAPGTQVRLGFLRPGSEVRYVELTRGWTMKRSVDTRWSNPLPPNHSLVPGALGPD